MSDFQRGWPQDAQASIPPRFRDGSPPYYVLTPFKLEMPVSIAEANARRAFWRGFWLCGIVVSPISAFVVGLIWRAFGWYLP